MICTQFGIVATLFANGQGDQRSILSRVIPKTQRPVGWGCRIRRLYLYRGVSPPPHPNEATCWPWVATRKALGRNSGG